MSKRIKKVIYPLLAAVIFAAAAGAYCLFLAAPAKNASALIIFTEAENNMGPVDTGTSRSVSALRRTVKDTDFLEKLSLASGVSKEKLRQVLTVERYYNSKGAQIIVSGLDVPAEAPIILINLLWLLEGEEDIPRYKVLSSCDILNEPKLPLWVCMSCSGLVGALICFFIMKLADRQRRQYYSPRKADENGEDYYAAVSMQEYIDDALHFAENLGTLPLSAPEGLEKSGYREAAKKLLSCSADASPAVIAIAPDFYYTGKGIPSQAKIAAYLACAFAENGQRTALIECSLKRPALKSLFKAADKGGLSDIAAGNCTIWDALAINAKDGVDVIAEKKSYPAPMAVFASGAYSQLMSYLSGQYDVMLLYSPKAWDCEEWKLIERRCTGTVIVMEEKSMLTANSARGMLAKECSFYAICTAPMETGR